MTGFNWRRLGGLSVTAALALSVLTTPALAADQPAPSNPAGAFAGLFSPDNPELAAFQDLQGSNERVRVIVLLKDQSRLGSDTGEAQSLATQEDLVAQWSEKYGLQLERQFGYLVNGFAATMPADKMAALEAEAAVASVKRERVYQTTDVAATERAADISRAVAQSALAQNAGTTQALAQGALATQPQENVPLEDASRDMQGAPAALADAGADGTGMVIAIVDTGIDPTHRDMRIDNCDTAKIKNINTAANPAFTCKVPNGYNYADDNFEIVDTTSSMHGMHVAGIAAANGLDEGQTFATTGRVEGMAPNAQLLAMKVFSNDPARSRGAADGDIIAAIEDSVKLGADVINLSLGSDNGFGYSNGAGLAIEEARAKGVLPVISAGNSGLNFSPSGGEDDMFGKWDDGVIGSPSAHDATLSVASIDNNFETRSVARVTVGDKSEDIFYELATGKPDNEPREAVAAGTGKPEEFPENTAGKYALIERGGITFGEKFGNAQKAGAAGVIIYNHEAGGDSMISMGGIDEYTFPGGVMFRSDALRLVKAIEAKTPVTIALTDEARTTPSATAGAPSNFTSWGPTSNLDFKPNISGVGGNVYSTLNSNTYGSMSGTSMAAPNVAGSMASVLQVLGERFPDMSRADRLSLAETLLMNTAEIPRHDGVPYAPRQIGAGLVRVDHALASQVHARVDGANSVALGQVNGPVSFTVTLTNHGDKEAAYAIPRQEVVNETNNANDTTSTFISKETLTADRKVLTVAPGETTQVTFTLTPSKGNHFVEGWAVLEGVQETPDIKVPYLGFAGDWNAEPIFVAPGQTWGEGNTSTSQLTTTIFGMTLPMKNNIFGEFWLSPNKDNNVDAVVPNLTQLRNAEEAQFEIYDAAGKLVTRVGEEQELSRQIAGTALGTKNIAQAYRTHAFDGTVWDASSASFKAIPDGRYTYRVKARLGDRFDWQTLDMPFGVDTVAPEVSVGEPFERDGQKILPFTVTETGSGIFSSPMVETDKGTQIKPVTKNSDSSFEVVLPEGVSYVIVTVADQGMNNTMVTKVLGANAIEIPSLNTYNTQVFTPNHRLVKDGKLTVFGLASDAVARVTVAGTDAELGGGFFAALVPLTAGTQEIPVVAYGDNGREITRTMLTVTYDTVAPSVAITSLNAGGKQPVAEDGSVTITGNVRDERPGATLTVKVNGTDVTVGATGGFTTTFTPEADAVSATVVASDGGNTTTETVTYEGREVVAEDTSSYQAPTFTNVQCFGTTCLPDMSTAETTADGKLVLRGKAQGVSAFVLQPRVTVNEAGAYVVPDPINVSVQADGTFETAVPVTTGINAFHMKVTDTEGKVRMDSILRVFWDTGYPKVSFTEPTLYNGVLYANSDEVTFAGTASDDAWGYELKINGSVVRSIIDHTVGGTKTNTRSFNQAFPVADGDTVLVQFGDSMGNTLLNTIPVVVDKEGPAVSINGTDGAVIRDGAAIATSVTDPNLKAARVLLNGNVLSEQSTDAGLLGQTVEDSLVDVKTYFGGGNDAGANGADAAKAVKTDANGVADKDDAARVVAGVKDAAGLMAEADAPVADDAAAGDTAGDAATALNYTVETAELAAGTYTLTVEGTDLAGNSTAQSISFTKDSLPVIEGPDTVELTAPAGALDRQALAAEVLAKYTVKDDGAAGAAGDTALTLAPGTVLNPGENTVTLIATDAAGAAVTKTVTVTVTQESAPAPSPTPGEPGTPGTPDPTPGQPVPNPTPAPNPTPGTPGTPGTPAPEPGTPGKPGDTGNVFYLSNDWVSTVAQQVFSYGRAADQVLIGDWDGDGKETLAVRRGNQIFIQNSLTGGVADEVISFGRADDTIVVGDWDGDGKDTFAVRRGNQVFVLNSIRSGDADQVFSFGREADVLLAGDFDGDGKDTFAVQRGNVFFVNNTLTGGKAETSFSYGRAGDQIFVGDWDGDGKDTFAVRRGNQVFVANSLKSGNADITLYYGRSGDQMLVGDWDGDGVDTPIVRR
ncbi:S8 family serine peptidase [Actinotignum sp. GS-2025b]|uniref:S8 family serine peptidase n=1 Tax=Actinotignum sp. GS-2025b TaxID=3427275 RepID=UPI003F463784